MRYLCFFIRSAGSVFCSKMCTRTDARGGLCVSLRSAIARARSGRGSKCAHSYMGKCSHVCALREVRTRAPCFSQLCKNARATRPPPLPLVAGSFRAVGLGTGSVTRYKRQPGGAGAGALCSLGLGKGPNPHRPRATIRPHIRTGLTRNARHRNKGGRGLSISFQA